MKQKVKCFLFIIFLLPQVQLPAQNFKTTNKKANELFLIEDYEKALPLLIWMDSISPGNAELNYKIGFSYLKTFHKAKALDFLLKAKEGGYQAPGIYFNLGLAYHANSKFEDAIQSFNKALSGITMTHVGDKKKRNDIERYKNMCSTALMLIAKPLDVKVENLGEAVNSPCPEYAPVISSDESLLIFTSRRPCAAKNEERRSSFFFEDVFISEKDSTGKWQKAKLMDKNINSEGHDASIALSPSGQTLLIYKDAGNGDIFESERKGNNWSSARRLPAPVNSNFWEPSASISANGSTLFFVSNRPGGFGGRDIYVVHKTESGMWGTPKNLGKNINTEFDEDAPFIHPDGRTLYFSSESHETMGGFDIFYSTFYADDSSWSSPVNVGFPINTVEDDMFFVWSADGRRAYYASEKEGGFGDKDLYLVTTNKAEASLILMKGTVSAKSNQMPLKARIVVTDNTSGKSIGTYYSDEITGKYTVFLTPGKNYGISVDAINYVPYSENTDIHENKYFELVKNIQLVSIAAGNKVVLRNIFFESGQSLLKRESYTELFGFLDFLNKNQEIDIEISGYTDDLGEETANQILSEDRAKAVIDFLIKNGIKKERMVARGYGESEPIASNATEEGRKLNRRTELRIIDKQKK